MNAGIYIYGSVIASIILYVNTVEMLKNIKKDENTAYNSLFGSVSLAFILYSILVLYVNYSN